jgi:hypothetical protein
MGHDEIDHIPESISCLQGLRDLTINTETSLDLPNGLGTLSNLTNLHVRSDNLRVPSDLQVMHLSCSSHRHVEKGQKYMWWESLSNVDTCGRGRQGGGRGEGRRTSLPSMHGQNTSLQDQAKTITALMGVASDKQGKAWCAKTLSGMHYHALRHIPHWVQRCKFRVVVY